MKNFLKRLTITDFRWLFCEQYKLYVIKIYKKKVSYQALARRKTVTHIFSRFTECYHHSLTIRRVINLTDTFKSNFWDDGVIRN